MRVRAYVPICLLRLILPNPLVLLSIYVFIYSLAPHSLSTIVKKFEEPRVLEIIDKISRNLLEGADDLRDIYATGIKTIISAVPKVLIRQSESIDECWLIVIGVQYSAKL